MTTRPLTDSQDPHSPGTPDGLRLCVRGDRCEDATTHVARSGVTFRGGAVLTDPNHQFCPTCQRYLSYAFTGFALDIADLTLLLPPTMEIRYRDNEVPVAPRVKKGSPLGFRAEPWTLIEAIDAETSAWAASVATEVDLPWDRHALHHMRVGARVQLCATFLREWQPHLLGLPEQRHRLSTDTDHRHLRYRVTTDAYGTWVWRNGTDAGLLFFDLHQQVQALCGRAQADGARMPCPKCQRPALVREPRRNLAVCRCCWHEYTDEEYEAVRDVLSTAFGIPT